MNINQLQKSSWLQTFTGKKFYPLSPEPELICIEDIAHSLAMQCRYNGHTKQFYSVAQHSVHLAEFYFRDDLLAKYALLHDASEAYLCDIPRPLKMLPQFQFYKEAELKLQSMIYQRFGLNPVEPQEISLADKDILGEEANRFMYPLHPDWDIRGGEMLSNESAWLPEKAKGLFLAMFYTLFTSNESETVAA